MICKCKEKNYSEKTSRELIVKKNLKPYRLANVKFSGAERKKWKTKKLKCRTREYCTRLNAINLFG